LDGAVFGEHVHEFPDVSPTVALVLHAFGLPAAAKKGGA
jgi:hypothetical protein